MHKAILVKGRTSKTAQIYTLYDTYTVSIVNWQNNFLIFLYKHMGTGKVVMLVNDRRGRWFVNKEDFIQILQISIHTHTHIHTAAHARTHIHIEGVQYRCETILNFTITIIRHLSPFIKALLFNLFRYNADLRIIWIPFSGWVINIYNINDK
jgi:hypothetical protein